MNFISGICRFHTYWVQLSGGGGERYFSLPQYCDTNQNTEQKLKLCTALHNSAICAQNII